MERKALRFVGSSLDDLRGFPDEARSEAGHQLDRVQQGLDPDDFDYMKTVGAGVFEVRIHEAGQAHRVFYVAKFEEAVYVLHAFEKKTQQTAKKDIDLGARRYRELVEERKPQKTKSK